MGYMDYVLIIIIYMTINMGYNGLQSRLNSAKCQDLWTRSNLCTLLSKSKYEIPMMPGQISISFQFFDGLHIVKLYA